MKPNTERLIAYLKAITSIHSPSGKESECAKYLAQHFSKYKHEIDAAGNVIVKIDGVGEPILLCAHMDVVDPSHDVAIEIVDGYIKNTKPCIIGIDDKSAIACFMEAVESLQETGTTHGPIEIIFTVEEETTSRGAIELEYAKISAKEGLVVDSALPIGGIITESPFYGTLDVSFSGPTHHTKSISKGETTAWSLLSKVITLLPHGFINEQTNVNWSTISGGTGRNTVTGEFILRGEIRSFNKDSYDKTISEIEKITRDESQTITFTHTYINAGYTTDEKDPWLTQITRTLQENNISPVTYIRDYGVSDINVIRTHGIHVFNLSSGAQHTHTIQETIAVADIEKMTTVIMELCKASH